MPQNGGFPPFKTPQDFFQKSDSVTFVPQWCPNFMQKIRKNLWTVSEISKDGQTADQGTDHGPTDRRTRAITKDPSGEPEVQKMNPWKFLKGHFRQNKVGCNWKNSSWNLYEINRSEKIKITLIISTAK